MPASVDRAILADDRGDRFLQNDGFHGRTTYVSLSRAKRPKFSTESGPTAFRCRLDVTYIKMTAVEPSIRGYQTFRKLPMLRLSKVPVNV